MNNTNTPTAKMIIEAYGQHELAEKLKAIGFVEDEPHLVLVLNRPKLSDFDIHEWQLLYDQYGRYFQLFIKGLGSAGRVNIKSIDQIYMLYESLTGKPMSFNPLKGNNHEPRT